MPPKSTSKKTHKASPKVQRLLLKKFLKIISRLLLPALLLGIVWFIFSRSVKPTFNGERAFQYLVQQCEFGPRNPASEGYTRCKQFLVDELEKHCDRVGQQEFEYRDKKDSTNIYRGTNIIASINLHPKKRKRIMLCAHWDTRPWADNDPLPENHSKPIIGANDGASGVAVLLELARALKKAKLDIGVDIILFDLEDIGDHQYYEYPDSLNPFSVGSEYFAEHNKQYRPAFGILIDMIGDSDLLIKKESYSLINAEPIVNKVWAAARITRATAFVDAEGGAVNDDHVPFLKRGIQVVDLIDFDYQYWHTMGDTPDKCSAESLQQLGNVLIEILLRE